LARVVRLVKPDATNDMTNSYRQNAPTGG
jgi:hypothetical protein